MNRLKLVAALEIVEPALSDSISIPIFSCVCFNKTTALAFNGSLAIETPLDTKLECAVQGKPLLDLLKASTARTVTLEANPGELRIKALGATFKLPVRLPEAMVFTMPKVDRPGFVSEAFVKAIEHCVRSVGPDSASAQYRCVTCVLGSGGISLYSTNKQTLSKAVVKVSPLPHKGTILIPLAFCKELVKLKPDSVSFHFTDDYILAVAGDTKLYTKLEALAMDETLLDLEKVVAAHVKADRVLHSIPASFEMMVERACVIAGIADKLAMRLTKITVASGQATMVTKTEHGEVTDSFTINGQRDIDLSIDHPKFLQKTEAYDGMSIDKAILFASIDLSRIYLISSGAGEA